MWQRKRIGGDGGNWSYSGDHFVTYKNIKSICCIPESNIILYVNILKFLKIDPNNTRKQKIMGGGTKNSEVTVISCSHIFAFHDFHYCEKYHSGIL